MPISKVMSFNGSRGMTLDVLSGKGAFFGTAPICVNGGPSAYPKKLLPTCGCWVIKLTATAGIPDFPGVAFGPSFGTRIQVGMPKLAC